MSLSPQSTSMKLYNENNKILLSVVNIYYSGVYEVRVWNVSNLQEFTSPAVYRNTSFIEDQTYLLDQDYLFNDRYFYFL